MLTVNVSPIGAGSVSVNGTIPTSYPYYKSCTPGSSVTLQAIPQSGFNFQNWSGSVTGTDLTVIAVMTCSKTATANFTPVPVTTGNIAGTVWHDSNANSIREASETGLEGINVHLYANDQIIDTALTGPGGIFNFNDLQPGTYRIRIVQPLNFCFSPEVNSNDVDYAGFSPSITLAAGDNATIDAGMYEGSTVPFTRQFTQGWNLFSVPVYTEPGNYTCDTFLNDIKDNLDIVWSYNSTSGQWSSYVPSTGMGMLKDIKDGSGYWFYLNNAADFSFSGPCLPSPPQPLPVYQLKVGWNLVGFKNRSPMPAAVYFYSVADSINLIYGFENNAFHTVAPTENLEPGQAYWVNVTQDGTVYPYLQIIGSVIPQAGFSLLQLKPGDPDFVILDVRTESEFLTGYIEGAINLNYYAATFQTDLANFDKRKTYLVYCGIGGRSASTVALMQQMGFREVYNLTGGLNAWKAEGLPWVQP